MIELSFFLTSVVLPALVWLWMHARNKRAEQRWQTHLAHCQCERAKDRASAMQDSVDATIERLDSRSPDGPVTISR